MDRPASAVLILGSSVPSATWFFINYACLQALTIMPFDLLQVSFFAFFLLLLLHIIVIIIRILIIMWLPPPPPPLTHTNTKPSRLYSLSLTHTRTRHHHHHHHQADVLLISRLRLWLAKNLKSTLVLDFYGKFTLLGLWRLRLICKAKTARETKLAVAPSPFEFGVEGAHIRKSHLSHL